jgi:hypothetical protein
VAKRWGVDGIENVRERICGVVNPAGGQKFAITTEGPHYGEIFVLEED